MKSKKIICIISLTYLLILFPVNLMSQDLFTAKEELTVFKKASINSDSIYTIDSNDEVEVLEIKSVWLKKWAKIRKSTGEHGYVFFHDLKPINTKQEIEENNTNVEDAATLNAVSKEKCSEPQKENTHDLEQKNANSSNEYTERNTTLNNEQDNSVSQADEKSNKSFPTWGWFAILGTIVLGYSTYLYKKFLYEKFTYNIFSLSTIVSLLLSFGTISFLNYSINHSETGVMWGIPSDTFKFLLITALILTIGILYYYNLRKTNWYFSIINIIIQSVAVGVFVIIAIGWIIMKILGSKSDSTTQSNSNSNSNNNYTIKKAWDNNTQFQWEFDGKTLKKKWDNSTQYQWEWDGQTLKKKWDNSTQYQWEFDGKTLKKKWDNSTQYQWEWDGQTLKKKWDNNTQYQWEFDGKIIKKKWDNSTQYQWEVSGHIPIPIIAKAIGII
jgi:hypothetical protein